MSPINISEIKNRVPMVQSAVKHVLKVDAGTQSTLDIIAASHGIKDFNTAKGLASTQYSAATNLGFDEHPCMMQQALGSFKSDAEAYEALIAFLHTVKKNMKWMLLKDGQPTGIREVSGDIPENELYAEIFLTGKTYSDLEFALEKAKQGIGSEYERAEDRNVSMSYRFSVSGKETNVLEDVSKYIVKNENDYAIIVKDKMVYESNDLSKATRECLPYTNDNREDLEGNALFLAQVEIADALLNDKLDYVFTYPATGSIMEIGLISEILAIWADDFENCFDDDPSSVEFTLYRLEKTLS